MPWGEAAFERARAEDKPILLSISAVWCHWCHVMDETSYSDPEVIAAINERFVPVRVDNDRRPDVNARYNMGGWPTTAFLAPDGATLTGGTYLPPAQMRRALDEIARFYADQKSAIAERASELRSARASYRPSSREELRESMIVRLTEEIMEGYDDEFGGFGDAPKFPQPELHEFLLSEWRVTGEERLHHAVAQTMLAMARGGTYDSVEGGFFRYSTTRDWSVPHFEKMAEDHAGLLRVLAQLVLFAPTPQFRETLVSASGYVRAVLRDAKTGLFAGSQDADEDYYALPLQDRRARSEPYVDRTSYTNWTCALAGAFALAGRALDDDTLVREAMSALDSVYERMSDADGLVMHFIEPGGEPHVRGLLADQAAYTRALLDVHEIAGEERFIERAVAHARVTLERFSAEDGGFYDRISGGETLGRLEIRDRPIIDNGIVAETLLRLGTLTGDTRFRESAEGALALFARTYAAAGPFAAPYARALRRYLSPETSVRIVGTAEATDAFREAAVRLPTPFVSLRTAPSGEALGLPERPQPAAYVCVGTACAAPATQAGQLRAAYDQVAGETRPTVTRT
jgi:uncharacterized protein YyaL (SSP411 family)